MASKLRSAIRAPERPWADGPTVAIERNVREVSLVVANTETTFRKKRGQTSSCLAPQVCGQCDQIADRPTASIASASVAPPPKLYRRGRRHQAAALRLRFRWPDLCSGCAASTDGKCAATRAAAGAVTTTSQARAATMKATAATRRAPSAARPRSIPAATTFGCATPAAHPCSCSRRRKALHRVAAGLQP